jgi:hypothetical protein
VSVSLLLRGLLVVLLGVLVAWLVMLLVRVVLFLRFLRLLVSGLLSRVVCLGLVVRLRLGVLGRVMRILLLVARGARLSSLRVLRRLGVVTLLSVLLGTLRLMIGFLWIG